MQPGVMTCAVFFLAVVVAIPADTNQSNSSGLTARQLYYWKPPATPPQPSQTTQPRPSDDGNKPATSTRKPTGRKKASRTGGSGDPASEPGNVQGSEPQSSQTAGSSPAPSNPAPKEQPDTPSTELPRLGLRYSVLMGSKEVDSQQSFRSGDSFRLRLTTNEPTYVYVVIKESQGNWKPLFPSPEIENNNNYVAAGQQIVVPGEQEFIFDSHPGEEKLVVVVSRQPERDLERLVDAVRRQSEPGGTPVLANKSDAVLSQNVISAGIPNDALEKYRSQLASRGVLVSHNPGKTGGYPAEKAVYVVTSASREERLIADIVLKHR